MPAQLILEFEGVTTEYDAVNAVLGIDPATGSGELPDGRQVHAVWDTPERQARFMEGRPSERRSSRAASRDLRPA